MDAKLNARISLKVTDNLRNRVMERAATEHRSVNWLVTQWILAGLHRRGLTRRRNSGGN